MAARIVPHETAAYAFKQSRHKHVPELPCRCVIVAPSGGGKSTFLVSLLLDIYRFCFNRIYVFSPNARSDVSDIWRPLEEFCQQQLKQEEPCLFESFDEGTVMELIMKHKRIIELCRQARRKELFQAAFIVDDFADDVRVMRGSASLNLLFVKGRHYGCSTFMSVQKYRTIAPIIRVNATCLIVFKLRSKAELEALAEENSAQYGQEATEKLILKATEEKYSFLFLDLCAADPRDMFYLRFEARLIPRGA